MNLMNLVEVAIGLALVYLLASTLCSGLNEWVAHAFSRRGRFLRRGLANVVTDRWLLLRLLNHPSIASLYRERPGKKRHPSYVPATLFATALVDLLVRRATALDPNFQPARPLGVADLRRAAEVCANAGFTVGRALLPLIDDAGDRIEQAHGNVEAWYEATMERVSGWYKQNARRWIFGLGLALAIALNIDSVELARALIQSDSLRTTVGERADAYLKTVQAAKELPAAGQSKDASPVTPEELRQRAAVILGLRDQALPIGYACLSPVAVADPNQSLARIARSCWQALPHFPHLGLKLIGWLITACAVSLGAPFWFDLLNRLVDVRGAGRKPAPAKP